jgi:hypothetical protein
MMIDEERIFLAHQTDRFPYTLVGVFPQHPHALITSGMVLCEDVGPFQSSKTRAAKAAFFLGADAEARRLGKARVTHGAKALAAWRYSPPSAAPRRASNED